MKNKIFSLEGEWENHPRDKTSVIDALSFLRNVLSIDFFHRRVATRAELEYHFTTKSKYKGYNFIYLAFHGEENTIFTNSDSEPIDLSFLEKFTDFFKDKILHISSCSVLNIEDEEIKRLKKSLQLKAISGYRYDVDWVDSVILEIDYFRFWAEADDDILNKDGEVSITKMKNKLFKKHNYLAEELGFVIL